jgi:hypothetical protein
MITLIMRITLSVREQWIGKTNDLQTQDGEKRRQDEVNVCHITGRSKGSLNRIIYPLIDQLNGTEVAIFKTITIH